ncbi:hypothetical protein [Acerihabitans arboris]|nr:hypothetical protein [Acerihabitans arboris]
MKKAMLLAIMHFNAVNYAESAIKRKKRPMILTDREWRKTGIGR